MRAARPRRGAQELRRVEETSAGGLVVTDPTGPAPQAALIGRYDRRGRLRWSMPKGHVEAGETAEQILEAHPRLTREAILAALAYAAGALHNSHFSNSLI